MILFLHVLLFFIFVKNDLLVISDVIICTGYTIFANILNLLMYIFRNNSKNKCLVKVKGTCCMFIGVKN